MSIARLQLALTRLPYGLREQILGYARTVDAAAPEIAREARVELDSRLREDLVFLAGLRKFYAICAASYWAIDNSTAFLRAREIERVLVGRTDYSRGGEMHRGLRGALADFDQILAQYELRDIEDANYATLLSRLASER